MPRPGIVVPILLPQHFSRLSATILTFLEAVEPYLHRHPPPTQDPDSPSRLTKPQIFSRLSTAILTFLKAVEPYLQRHPYNNIGFRFHSSPYQLHDFVPYFYHHFNVSESVEPYLQRHPYTNIRFGFLSSPLLSTILPSFYHHFNVS